MQQDESGAERAPLKLSDIPERLPLLTYVIEIPGRAFSYLNSRSFDLLGYSVDELHRGGLAFLDAKLHYDDGPRVRAAESRYQTVRDDEVISVECRVRHRDGRWRWLRRREVVLARDADSGLPLRILGVAEDVSEWKASERHLVRDHERMLRLLAYDIHDGFVQDVVGAQMALESVIEMIGVGETDCMQELILLRGLLRKAIGDGRRMITELRPMIIDEMGVVEAINYLVGEEEAADRLEVKFTHAVEFERLAPMLEGTIFRITQEALTNIRRHAGVDAADVRLIQVEDQLHLEIEDHGCGFALDALENHHYGLEGIRERAKIFGGHAQVETVPGEGTRISVWLPIELPPEWREPESCDQNTDAN